MPRMAILVMPIIGVYRGVDGDAEIDDDHHIRRDRRPRPSGKLGFVGEVAATQKLTITAKPVGTGVPDGPETMGVDVLHGDAKKPFDCKEILFSRVVK